MKRLISISFIFLFFLSYTPLSTFNLEQDGRNFDQYQYTLTRDEAEEKICQMLQKDPEVAQFYTLSDDALIVYASEIDKKNNHAEFTLYFGNKEKPVTYFPLFDNPYRPLKGLRVAIDPGHFGKEYAKIEEKYVDLKPNLSKGIFNPIQFDEGTLSIITAKNLSKKLENLGATVFLTRSQPGETVYKEPFDQWRKNNFNQAIERMVAYQQNPDLQKIEKNWWLTKAKPSEVFKSTYVYVDLERRAELINAFKPHITISCHYNLGGIYDKEGQTPGTDDDYSLFFVPGAFKKGSTKHEAFCQQSLKSPRSRYEFIRLLVTNDLEDSIDLALICQKHCNKKLKLPTGDHCNYLKVLCLKDSPGIYHRNLTLPRLVHSPFLYPEPLCQDNYENAKSLDQNPNIIIDKMVTVYTKAILEWAERKSLP